MSAISITKANRLFWLGRYTERLYTNLHFVRKCFDEMIDENEYTYISFCDKMGISNIYQSSSDFIVKYLYDEQNSNSLNATLRCAYDNGIELREEIKSESLSYIQMSIAHMDKCVELHPHIDELQCITDYLLAFWGSTDERVFDRRIKALLRTGKFLECMDLHIRFGYSFERVAEIYSILDLWISQLDSVYDKEMRNTLDILMRTQEENFDESCRLALLRCLNCLFAA